MKRHPNKFCPRCGSRLAETSDKRKSCSASDCDFVDYDNPIPVVAVIVEREDGVIFAHNRAWPSGMLAPITGFIDTSETPHEAALRELREDLGLHADKPVLIGAYGFPVANQLIIAYHVQVQGKVILGDELDAYKVIPVHKLKGWDFGTGLAVRDWLQLHHPARDNYA